MDDPNIITNTQLFIKKIYKDNYEQKYQKLLQTAENDILNALK